MSCRSEQLDARWRQTHPVFICAMLARDADIHAILLISAQ
jgi:hypothetical protein